MASNLSTKDFFARGSSNQFDYIFGLYDTALRLKAESKSSKPENVIKLDKWYQNELPKKIKSRGKDAHLIHDELVQTIKWKLARGKFRPNLTNLIQMNTPRVVMQDTKKAFRNLNKRNDLQAAANALCNLKGVGPAMASAVLAAGAPHLAPFMADECLLAMPDVDSLDYTMKEYMRYVDYVKECVERLNSQGGADWTPHKVELTVWTHYILRELNPELLTDMPAPTSVTTSSDTSDKANGQVIINEDTKSSVEDEDSNSAIAKNSDDETSNSNGEAPAKTNGNNATSQSEDSTVELSTVECSLGPDSNRSDKNGGGDDDDKAPTTNGQVENGTLTTADTESKSADHLSSCDGAKSVSPSAPVEPKRPVEEVNAEKPNDNNSAAGTAEEPAPKKLKTCDDAPKEETPAPLAV